MWWKQVVSRTLHVTAHTRLIRTRKVGFGMVREWF